MILYAQQLTAQVYIRIVSKMIVSSSLLYNNIKNILNITNNNNII